jgi:hypothetical protein
MNEKTRVWLARAVIGLVTFFNLECALVFILWPQIYAPSFELMGLAGEEMLRGMGVLFVMWNIPYLVAFWNPVRNRTSLFEALIMQAVGFLGETLILLSLPAGHGLLNTSILRFIYFDGAGLFLLLIAVWLIRRK